MVSHQCPYLISTTCGKMDFADIKNLGMGKLFWNIWARPIESRRCLKLEKLSRLKSEL